MATGGMQAGARVPNNREDEGSHFQREFSLKFQECFDLNQALLEGEREKWHGGVLPVQANKQTHCNLAGSLTAQYEVVIFLCLSSCH